MGLCCTPDNTVDTRRAGNGGVCAPSYGQCALSAMHVRTFEPGGEVATHEFFLPALQQIKRHLPRRQ